MHGKYCEICGERPAEIEFIEVVHGIKRKLHLCRVCAEKEANGLKIIVPEESDGKFEVVCPECGTPLSYVKTTLRVGCPTCYSVFEGEVKDLLKKLQGSSTFSAHDDLKTSEEKDLILIKHRLKKELEEAVESEDFEKAARLRDEINEIDRRLKWLGSNPSD